MQTVEAGWWAIMWTVPQPGAGIDEALRTERMKNNAVNNTWLWAMSVGGQCLSQVQVGEVLRTK
jgi:hypothetical protein